MLKRLEVTGVVLNCVFIVSWILNLLIYGLYYCTYINLTEYLLLTVANTIVMYFSQYRKTKIHRQLWKVKEKLGEEKRYKIPNPEELEKEYRLNRQNWIDSNIYSLKASLISYYKNSNPQEKIFVYSINYDSNNNSGEVMEVIDKVSEAGWFVYAKEIENGKELTIMPYPKHYL